MIKKLIERDDNAIAYAVSNINDELIPIIQKIIDDYSNLEIGDITEEDLTDIYDGMIATSRKYISEQKKAFQKVKIRGNALRELLNKASEDLDPLRSDLRDFRDLDREVIPLKKYVTIEDKKAILNKENLEKIKELYSRYITSPEENKLYSKHLEIIKDLNDIIEAYKKKNQGGLPVLLDQLLKMIVKQNNVKDVVEIGHIDYSQLV